MNHPERMPEAHHIAKRITEADIKRQQIELDQLSARMMAANVYNATPREDIKKIGELLTGTESGGAFDPGASNKNPPNGNDKES